MYKVVAIGANQVSANMAFDGKIITFQTYEEAELFLKESQQKVFLPDNYKLIIKKE
ncbi:hypothetical protein [Virgibacillus sp. SK37]|uniref:hypothetical protein n=1 Tax=Virgibacillus sp. SK37 TaxID=403957 RepID=UPI0004D130B5|nr:hypothetical protein [Virgibacillus sp. SK37]AIF45615.1 hypothetical protein X953_17635 [Virgibacillus sp. SK37]